LFVLCDARKQSTNCGFWKGEEALSGEVGPYVGATDFEVDVFPVGWFLSKELLAI
jgi:hypothetical protein